MADATLFDLPPLTPAGFNYQEEFLSREQEQALLETVQSLALKPLIFKGYEAKRKVQSYGYDYHFDSRKISPGKEVPEGLHFLIEMVAGYLNRNAEDFKEVLVSEYPPGSVINWHRDAPPFQTIVGISLLQDCTFKLRPYDKSKQSRKSIISLPVKRRSLYVLDGHVREDWEHSTMPVASTRYSITLRTLRLERLDAKVEALTQEIENLKKK